MASITKIPMTINGARKLREELHELKYVKRPQIIDAVSTARDHGDLKENAEYHAAREQYGFLEGRIADIESMLSMAQVIDVTQLENNGRVIFGATVKLRYLKDHPSIVTYQIVGEDEAEISQCKISITSPVARGLIGKHVGDEVIVETVEGHIIYKIIDVAYI